jgi:O-antigen/teichoic acid export membrane protein
MVGAIAWSMIDRFGQQIVQFIFGIVLARLLMPSEVGQIGVLMIFVAFSSVLIDGGFSQAIIRKQNASETDYNTIFYSNLLISVALYLLLFFAAPFIADFFKQPKLTAISRVLFLSTIFYGLSFIQFTLIIKQLKYKSYAIINISGFFISGSFAVTMAFMGYGVWALVAQQLGFHCIRFLMFPFFIKWRPSFSYSFKIIEELWSFSIRLMGTNMLNVLFGQVYTVLFGRFFSFQQVGFYYQANKLSETINGTTQQVIQNATYPLFSKIQEDDSRMLRIYRQLTKSISFIIFPFNAFLIVIAYPLLITILSLKWKPSVELFQLLIIANFFNPLYLLNISLLNSRGESKRTFRLEIVKKMMILISIVICFQMGIKAMLIGFIFASIVAYFLSFIQIRRSLKLPLKNQILDILSFLIFSWILGFFVNLINLIELNLLLKLLIQSSLAILMFIMAALTIFKDQFGKIRELTSQVF